MFHFWSLQEILFLMSKFWKITMKHFTIWEKPSFLIIENILNNICFSALLVKGEMRDPLILFDHFDALIRLRQAIKKNCQEKLSKKVLLRDIIPIHKANNFLRIADGKFSHTKCTPLAWHLPHGFRKRLVDIVFILMNKWNVVFTNFFKR